jgi:Uma2 family endonuclease
MDAAVTNKRLISVKEYHQMSEAGILNEQENIELINGEIIQMGPTGSRHAAAVKKISKLLHSVIKDKVISVQDPVTVNDLSEPEPDIAVLKPRENFYADKHPEPKDVLLVIEIAESSIDFDKQVKLPLYARANIPAVWLVDLNSNRVEIHQTPVKGVYKQVEYKLPGEKIDSEIIGQPLHSSDLMINS